MSLITEPETVRSVVSCIDLHCKGLENFIAGLDSYDPEDIIKYALDNCWICAGYTKEALEGVFIFSWVTEEIVNLHICTMNNKYNWHKFYENEIRPFIAQHAKYQCGFVTPDQKALVRLYRRYGYELEWGRGIEFV